MPFRGPVQRVLAYIDEHLDDDLTLANIARVAALSPFHLQRLVVAATGLSPSRRVQLLRLKRAAMQLAFVRARSITAIAIDAGFSSNDAFARAFRRVFGRAPRDFRRAPRWDGWHARFAFQRRDQAPMNVRIVDFPETRVAALEHHGPPHLEYETSRRFIAWRIAHKVSPARHRTYGVHHTDPRTTPPAQHRMDLCVSYNGPVAPNPQGVIAKVLPGGRCAVARHLGSREHVAAAAYLAEVWLPSSGETLRDAPLVFHYVNVGPDVQDHEMITDVYLPLR